MRSRSEDFFAMRCRFVNIVPSVSAWPSSTASIGRISPACTADARLARSADTPTMSAPPPAKSPQMLTPKDDWRCGDSSDWLRAVVACAAESVGPVDLLTLVLMARFIDDWTGRVDSKSSRPQRDAATQQCRQLSPRGWQQCTGVHFLKQTGRAATNTPNRART